VLKRQFLAPTFLVFGMECIILMTGIPSWTGLPWAVVMVALLVGAVLSALDLYVLAWAGLWWGLKARNTTSAVNRTILYVLIMPWILLAASLALTGLLTSGHIFDSDWAWLALVWAFLLFVASDLGMLAWAINHMREDFSTALAQY
jgi:hypothetical protein